MSHLKLMSALLSFLIFAPNSFSLEMKEYSCPAYKEPRNKMTLEEARLVSRPIDEFVKISHHGDIQTVIAYDALKGSNDSEPRLSTLYVHRKTTSEELLIDQTFPQNIASPEVTIGRFIKSDTSPDGLYVAYYKYDYIEGAPDFAEKLVVFNTETRQSKTIEIPNGDSIHHLHWISDGSQHRLVMSGCSGCTSSYLYSPTNDSVTAVISGRLSGDARFAIVENTGDEDSPLCLATGTWACEHIVDAQTGSPIESFNEVLGMLAQPRYLSWLNGSKSSLQFQKNPEFFAQPNQPICGEISK